MNSKFNKRNEKSNTGKKTEINRVLSPIPPRPSKDTLKKSKFYQNKNNNITGENINKDNCLYIYKLYFLVPVRFWRLRKTFPTYLQKNWGHSQDDQ